MKLVLINTLYPPTTIGGAERSVAALARGMAKAGHDVHAIALHAGTEWVDERIEGVTVHRLPMRNVYWPFDHGSRRSTLTRARWHLRDSDNPAAARDVAALLQELAPDVVHTNNLTGFGARIMPLAHQFGARLVHTLRDYSLTCSRASLFRNGRDCNRRCAECIVLTARKRTNATAVDTVVSNSAYTLERHRAYGYFAGTPAMVIRNIADVRRPAAERPARPIAAPIVFGFIGRVEEEKGVEDVLAALARSPGRDWRLHIAGVGEPGYVGRLQREYGGDRVAFLGHSDADAFYRAVDVVVIASRWPEPMPRIMLECLGRGIPVVYADSGGTGEMGRVHPRAIEYPAGNVEALSQVLTRVIDDGAVWRERVAVDEAVLDLFSETTVVARYLEAYSGSPVTS